MLNRQCQRYSRWKNPYTICTDRVDNYLFHQIYKCANTTPSDDNHYIFYNFGNNLRKFLEAYLFYKYPVQKDNKEKGCFNG